MNINATIYADTSHYAYNKHVPYLYVEVDSMPIIPMYLEKMISLILANNITHHCNAPDFRRKKGYCENNTL